MSPDEPEQTTLETPEATTVKPAKSSAAGALWFLFFLFLVLIAAAGGLGYYYGWPWLQQQLLAQSELRESVLELRDSRAELHELRGLRSLRPRVDELAEQFQQQSERLEEAFSIEQVPVEQWQQSQATIASLSERLQAQSQVLRSLSTTTRSDWLLAEAEYLLRLANQRLLMEGSTAGAQALLESADEILREVDDLDLFSIREQLNRDLATVKLVQPVDQSGIYLRLSALIEKVLQLPITVRSLPEPPQPENPGTVSDLPQQELDLWGKLKHNFFRALSKVGEQVRVRRHDQPVVHVLPPGAESYLRQNIALNLEQAQLALLRREREVYRGSLQQAGKLLQRHFSASQTAMAIASEVGALADETIEVQLPDISPSYEALREFNTRLHKLDSEAGTPLQGRPGM